MQSNKQLLIGMLLAPFVYCPMGVFTIFILGWLRQTGISDDQAYSLFSYQGTIGNFSTVLFLFIFGRFVDKIDPRVFISVCLLLRAGIFFAFFLVDDPNGWQFKVFAPLSHSTFHMVIVSFNGFYVKMFPKEIRGILGNLLGILS